MSEANAVTQLSLPFYRERSTDEVLLGTAAHYLFDSTTQPTFQEGDIWLGRSFDGHPVGIRDDRHALISGGSRSEKGVSLVLNNLFLWPGSSVTIAPKAENAIVAARARANGSIYCKGRKQKTYLLDSTDSCKRKDDQFDDLKACFNVLDMIKSDDDEAVDTAGRIADSIIVIENLKEPFFEEVARDKVLRGLMLHVVSSEDYEDHERNLITVRRLLLSGEAEMRRMLEMNDADYIPTAFELLFEGMRRNPAFDGLVSQLGESLANLAQESSRTFASVWEVACAHTAFLDSPGMKRCLAKSDFEIAELKTDPKGVSVFLCLPQRYMETHYRWLRMMITLITTEMERVPGQPASGHPVLMILDGFAGLKRMKTIENATAQIAGFGVKMMFVTQTLAQLKDIYKDNWETFITNAGVKLFLGNDDHFTREYASKLIGDREVVRTGFNFSRMTGTAKTKARTVNWSKTTSTSTTTSDGEVIGTSNGKGHGPGIFQFTSNRGNNKSWSKTTSKSRSQSNTDGGGETFSDADNESKTAGRTESIHKRPLLTPDEIGRHYGDRDKPKVLALLSGQQPISLCRSRYYNDPFFRGKFDPHPDHPNPQTLKEHELSDQIAGLNNRLALQKQMAEQSQAEATKMHAEQCRKIKQAWAYFMNTKEGKWQAKLEEFKKWSFAGYILLMGAIGFFGISWAIS